MAQVEFQNIVGSAAVEMRPLGQDSDSLLVDLKKSPMDQSSDVPISVREYLVFIEVARYFNELFIYLLYLSKEKSQLEFSSISKSHSFKY